MGLKRLAHWTIVFGVLGAFTIWVGAAYAQPKQQLLNSELTRFHSARLVDFEEHSGNFEHKEVVCTLTADQLKELQAAYNVNISQRHDDGKTITVASIKVNGQKDAKQIKQIVGADKANQCKQHIYRSILYFFTVPSLS